MGEAAPEGAPADPEAAADPETAAHRRVSETAPSTTATAPGSATGAHQGLICFLIITLQRTSCTYANMADN